MADNDLNKVFNWNIQTPSVPWNFRLGNRKGIRPIEVLLHQSQMFLLEGSGDLA